MNQARTEIRNMKIEIIQRDAKLKVKAIVSFRLFTFVFNLLSCLRVQDYSYLEDEKVQSKKSEVEVQEQLNDLEDKVQLQQDLLEQAELEKQELKSSLQQSKLQKESENEQIAQLEKLNKITLGKRKEILDALQKASQKHGEKGKAILEGIGKIRNIAMNITGTPGKSTIINLGVQPKRKTLEN